MPLDHSIVGQESEPTQKSWDHKDALLYALGLGAGHDDQFAELEYTTEHGEHGSGQKVLPSYGVMVTWGAGGGRKMGDFDPAKLVHAEQSIELHRPLPTVGSVRITSMVTGIRDKGSGALVSSQARAVDAETGEPVVTSRSSAFIMGEGGFGDPTLAEGADAGIGPTPVPDRAPDEETTMRTWPGQALLYRLSGDWNPLHSNPEFAARGGFDKPILHGLCTYGISCRALVSAMAGKEMTGMAGRFSSPVIPGEELTVARWHLDDGSVAFQTRRADGTVVLDRGLSTWA
ncbi:MaoC/PaaZ C-terminal domain-containing protein [Nocardioides insulae]|uniref:MaoC/PaaZ C-terminal domain-containing protein n=1 Tax=Nocardioides insulae TaxID=394734 RepID=UPI0004229B82|nr:MaoC/PaaZ C-terminal domain-containing protein [Nocardioides insulae]